MPQKTTEEKILRRYIELGGLVKDGQMVNPDKKSRAEQWVRVQGKFVERVLAQKRIELNSKYGKFIIQTNEVQSYLIALIKVRTFSEDKKFRENLERTQLGALVGYFTVLARSEIELEILDLLKAYKDYRDALAHKMFTDNKLTPEECDEALRIGEKLIGFFTADIKQGGLSELQIMAIVSLLHSFGAEQSVMDGAEKALRGNK
jgi:hypothetical protein